MTPSELRELADALAKGTHFVDSPELHAAMQNAADYLRACADEKPMAWMALAYSLPSQATTDEPTAIRWRKAGGEVVPLYLHPAPAAPQAEPKREPSEKQIADACYRYRHDFGLLDKYEQDCVVNEARRWADAFGIGGSDEQAEREPCIGNDPACPCQDGDPCHYRDTETTKAWPIPQVDQKREPWSGYEAGHRAGYALALTERRTDDCTFETDTPDEHTHIEEVRALLRGDTGLKEQAKPPRQAGQEISLGALMREQRQSRIVAGAYPDGNPNAGAMMAQTPQAGPQREPLRDALKTVIYELAALIPNPDKTLVDDWPCENAADRQCLQIAYTTARSVLHGIGGSDAE